MVMILFVIKLQRCERRVLDDCKAQLTLLSDKTCPCADVMVWCNDWPVVFRGDIVEYWRRFGDLRRSTESCRWRPPRSTNCRRDASDRESTMHRLFELAEKRLRPLPANRGEHDHRWAEDMLRQLRQVDGVRISTARYNCCVILYKSSRCFG